MRGWSALRLRSSPTPSPTLFHQIVLHRVFFYGFWLSLPFYIFMQRELYYPYNYIHSVSLPALSLVGFLIFYYSLKYISVNVFLSAIALRLVGFLTIIILVFCVIVSGVVQFFCFFLILAVLIGFATEIFVYFRHYAIRRSTPKFMNRCFRRLGALMTLCESPIYFLYKIWFLLIGICLLLLHLLLIYVQYFHTVWVFNRNVALRMLPKP